MQNRMQMLNVVDSMRRFGTRVWIIAINESACVEYGSENLCFHLLHAVNVIIQHFCIIQGGH